MGQDLKLTVKLFLAWITLLILLAFSGGLFFGDLNRLNISNLANWDGEHFLAIAEDSYTQKKQYAFFPLYPLLINLVSKTFGIEVLYSGILLNFLSTFGVIYFFIKLLKKYKIKNVLRILILFLIFPTSFYLITVYSESIFLLFVLQTFYFAEEKKFLQATIFAGLASLTRLSGIAVIFALWVECFRSRVDIKEKIIVLLAPLGFILYLWFQYSITSNPFYFLESELNWDRTITFPGVSIWTVIWYLNLYGIHSNYNIFLDLLFTIFGVGIGLRSIKFLKPSLTTYTLVSLMIPFTSSILLSFPRFLIVVFPLFILISQIKNKVFLLSYVIISLTFLFIYFNFFLRSLWVS